MNLDDLKTQWRSEVEQASPAPDLQFDRIKRDVTEFNRSVRLGNFWMIFGLGCGSLLGVVFGWLLMDGVGWQQKVAIGTHVIVTIWVAFMLLRARRVTRSDDWTLRSRLETEIERLEKQQNLWKYGGLWFLAPATVFALLNLPARLYWVWFVLCVIAFWSVRHGMRKTVGPLLSRLKDLHRELIESE